MVSAHGLVPYKDAGVCNPYCVLSVDENRERTYTTTIQKKSLDPVWGEDYVLFDVHFC